MATASSPTVWRRWLAFELRRLRDSRGLSQRDVGRSCGWSGARLSYLENAQQNVSDDDLDKLLPLYAVPDNDQPRYYEAAEFSHRTGWWEQWDTGSVADWFSLFLGLEQGASDIRGFEVTVVPGLLQTADYAAAVIAADVIPRMHHQVMRQVDLRLARQAALHRTTDPLGFQVVIDESALRRVAKDAATMAAQLDHIVTMSEKPNVTVQVLPFSRGVHAYTFGAFQILTFPFSADLGVVWVEHRSGAAFLEEPRKVDSHALVFQHLSSELALTPDESIAMIRNVAKEYHDRVP